MFAGGTAVRRVAGAVVVLVASLGLGGAVASAQPYPPVEAAVMCGATTAEAGQSVVCEGSGFGPGSDVDIEAVSPDGRSVFSDTVQADANGVARSLIAFGSNPEDGAYQVSFSGVDDDGAEAGAVQVVQVREGVVDPGEGMSLRGMLFVLLVVLILVGSAVVAWRQRSNVARTPT
jgi:hypothetical protein